MKRRCVARGAVVGAGALGFALWRAPKVRARCGELRAGLRRRAHRLEGRADGWLYRLLLDGPRPDVADDIVAERVRATLGPVVHERDLPHVHVLVEHHVAVLHGDVGDDADRAAIEGVASGVPGVAGVESHLHVGLLPGDTRPSAGRQPSPELHALVAAARRHGGGEATALVAVKAILGTLAALLPPRENEHLTSHLPPDVGALLVPPRRVGTLRHVRTAEQLERALSATGFLTPGHARLVLEHVLPALRLMVPDDATDVALLLPPEIRSLWDAPAPVADA